MAFQKLKSVVTLGGAVDGSFEKVGSAFNSSIGKSKRAVKDLEREQQGLTRSIKTSQKASEKLAGVESKKADLTSVGGSLETDRKDKNKAIRRERELLKKLNIDKDEMAKNESADLSAIEKKIQEVNARLNDQVEQRDKLTKSIKENSKEQDELNRESSKLKTSIKNVDELTEQYDELGREIDRVSDRTKAFQRVASETKHIKSMAKTAGMVVGAVWSATTATAGLMTVTNAQTTEMVGMAKAYDMSIKQFQTWGGVAQQAGLNAENVGDLVEELSNKFGEFKALGKQSSVSDAFGALGLTKEMLDSKSAVEQFELIMHRIQGVSDKQQAASIADMLFGGEGNKLATYIRNTGQSLSGLLVEQEKFVLLTEKGAKGAVAYGSAFYRLKSGIGAAWQEISGIVGGELSDDINKLSESVVNWVKANKKELAEDLLDTVKAAVSFGKVVFKVGSAINSVVQAMGGWQTIGIAVGSLIAAKLVVGVVSLIGAGITLVRTVGLMSAVMSTFNVVLAANPIGLAVVAVGALIFAGVQLYRNWDKITNWFDKKLTAFKTKFVDTFGFVGDIWNGITGLFGDDKDINIGSTVSHAIKQNNSSDAGKRAVDAIYSAAPANKGNTVHQNIGDIKVYAAPGQSPVEVAKEVHSKISGHQSSALYDLPA
ncbi:hypothetical protein [Shewanella surugensis]|uniref:Phage tail tape measure protein n=1 Tax=Shewanella surugensis TaxID=212020 RepID=A0ABT0L925_9GAMM|nr:hypothetical protein [Shewanella surugensis]MCL1124168.1 hypothetical protein [Shewanella surugensis]